MNEDYRINGDGVKMIAGWAGTPLKPKYTSTQKARQKENQKYASAQENRKKGIQEERNTGEN